MSRSLSKYSLRVASQAAATRLRRHSSVKYGRYSPSSFLAAVSPALRLARSGILGQTPIAIVINGPQRGFSFVEVIAALVILSISLTVLLNSQGNAVHIMSRSRKVDTAVTLGGSKMAELTMTNKRPASGLTHAAL